MFGEEGLGGIAVGVLPVPVLIASRKRHLLNTLLATMQDRTACHVPHEHYSSPASVIRSFRH